MVTSKLIEHPVVTSKQYPYMGQIHAIEINTTMVILFSSPKTGAVVHSSNHQKMSIGEYSTTWNEEMFKPFVGSITLEESPSTTTDVVMEDVTSNVFVLSYHTSDIKILATGHDREALRKFADKKVGFDLIWEEDGIYWGGREMDQCDDYYFIAPMGTELDPNRNE